MVPVRARGWSLRRDDVIPGRWIVGAISTRVSSQRGIAVREVTADRDFLPRHPRGVGFFVLHSARLPHLRVRARGRLVTPSAQGAARGGMHHVTRRPRGDSAHAPAPLCKNLRLHSIATLPLICWFCAFCRFFRSLSLIWGRHLSVSVFRFLW